jgi:hypothetical protein
VTLHLAVRSNTGIDDVNALKGATGIAGGTTTGPSGRPAW